MINPQIVEYYSAQIKAGATRDDIKNALVGAGWAVADVEDSIRSKEAAAPAPVRQPAPVQKMTPAISVSDLIPGSSQVSTASTIASSSRMPGAVSKGPQPQKKAFTMPRIPVLPIVLGVVAIVGFGFAGYFYMQNNDAQGKLTAVSGASDSANSNVANLTAQVATLTKSQSDLTAQVAALTSANSALLGELSFFAVAPAPSAGSSTVSSTAADTASASVNFKGMVSGGGKSLYIITDAVGVKISIVNSKDAKVDAAFKPLLGQNAQIAGTHIPGSNIVTVTAVNGSSVL